MQTETENKLSFEQFKQRILNDFRTAVISREASLIGRKEVLTGKAKFGILETEKKFRSSQWQKYLKTEISDRVIIAIRPLCLQSAS